MKSLFSMGVVLVLAIAAGVAFGEEKADDESRAAHLQRMKSIAGQFEIEASVDRKPFAAKLAPKPLLRYNDPTRRQVDESTLWLWTERERPCALMAVEFYPNSPKGPRWLVEVVSLSDSRIGVTRGDRWKWQAKQPGVIRRPIPDGGEPSEKASLRLTQARQIRSRFAAHEKEGTDGRIELRPLSNPIYRYKDEEAGVIDGLLFAFANGTNPEVLLVLEAQRETTTSAAIWIYGLAQMTGAGVYASLDDREVWQQREADPPAIRDSYVNDWLKDIEQEPNSKSQGILKSQTRSETTRD